MLGIGPASMPGVAVSESPVPAKSTLLLMPCKATSLQMGNHCRTIHVPVCTIQGSLLHSPCPHLHDPAMLVITGCIAHGITCASQGLFRTNLCMEWLQLHACLRAIGMHRAHFHALLSDWVLHICSNCCWLFHVQLQAAQDLLVGAMPASSECVVISCQKRLS